MFIAVPVQVRGTIAKPIVVPLGPTAVGSRLLDIMGNTLKLPGEAIKIVTPSANATQQPTTPTRARPLRVLVDDSCSQVPNAASGWANVGTTNQPMMDAVDARTKRFQCGLGVSPLAVRRIPGS